MLPNNPEEINLSVKTKKIFNVNCRTKMPVRQKLASIYFTAQIAETIKHSPITPNGLTYPQKPKKYSMLTAGPKYLSGKNLRPFVCIRSLFVSIFKYPPHHIQ